MQPGPVWDKLDVALSEGSDRFAEFKLVRDTDETPVLWIQIKRDPDYVFREGIIIV